MSNGVIITLIICGTILLISVLGIAVAIYAIKKGVGFAEKGMWQDRDETNKEEK